jgi:hypothetical protein
MTENDILQLEESLKNLPKEVKIFLYEGAFENALLSIKQSHTITDDQQKELKALLVKILCFLASKDTLIELFTSWGFPQEKQVLIAKDIDEKIFAPIVEATNYIVEGGEDTDEEVTSSSVSETGETIKDPYAELQKRFVYGTPIVRAEKKAYSLDKFPLPPRIKENDDGMLVPPPAPKSDIDPYREKPE